MREKLIVLTKDAAEKRRKALKKGLSLLNSLRDLEQKLEAEKILRSLTKGAFTRHEHIFSGKKEIKTKEKDLSGWINGDYEGDINPLIALNVSWQAKARYIAKRSIDTSTTLVGLRRIASLSLDLPSASTKNTYEKKGISVYLGMKKTVIFPDSNGKSPKLQLDVLESLNKKNIPENTVVIDTPDLTTEKLVDGFNQVHKHL